MHEFCESVCEELAAREFVIARLHIGRGELFIVRIVCVVWSGRVQF